MIVRALSTLVYLASFLFLFNSIDFFELSVYRALPVDLRWAFLLTRILLFTLVFFAISEWTIRANVGKRISGLFASLALILGTWMLVSDLTQEINNPYAWYGWVLIANGILSLIRSRRAVEKWAMRPIFHYILGLVVLPVILIASPVDLVVGMSPDNAEEEYEKASLTAFLDTAALPSEGMVIFSSTGCTYCRRSMHKLTSWAMKKGYGSEYITNVTYNDGSTEEWEAFYTKYGAPHFNTLVIGVEPFLKMVSGRMPLIVEMKGGELINAYRYRTFDDSVAR